MSKTIRSLFAGLLASTVMAVIPATAAHAVTATGTDPTGDVTAGPTYDITQLSVDLTSTTVTTRVKFAAAMPALTDSSWSATSDTGRLLAISLGDSLGFPGFILDGDGVTAIPWDFSTNSACDSATQSISGDTITLSAPASCFRYPGKVQVTASVQKGAGTSNNGDIDVAIAPTVTDNLQTSDITTVDASLPGGYYQLGADGGVFSFGDAAFYGSTGNIKLNSPVVAMTTQPAGTGYRFVAGDGGVFSYGSAAFYGSMGGSHLNKPIVGMATTATGNGYWLVASDGGIFAYGDASFYGSMGGTTLNKPVVGMVPSATGHGYLLVASDGGIFAFGDAQFHGSAGSTKLNSAIVGVAPTNDGGGYWLAAKDGGVFAYGNAHFYGSGADEFDNNVVGIGHNSTNNGYYLASDDGLVLNYGTVNDFGDVARLGVELNKGIAGIAVKP